MAFRDFILKIARPGFLSPGPPNSPARIGQGGRYLYGIGLALDAMAERLRQATLARLPGYGTDTALPYHGRDRGIRRGFAATPAVYAVQLQQYLDTWKGAGNCWTLLTQLSAYLSPYPTKLRTIDNTGNCYTLNADGTRSITQGVAWDWDSLSNANQSTEWARIWVIIYADTFLTEQEVWGNANQWSGQWGYDGVTWGTTATPNQIRDIRDICKRWCAAHMKLMTIVLAFDNTSFDPATVVTDGSWGRWHKISGGVGVKSRPDTARYLEIEP